jgi:hypothetical protein
LKAGVLGLRTVNVTSGIAFFALQNRTGAMRPRNPRPACGRPLCVWRGPVRAPREGRGRANIARAAGAPRVGDAAVRLKLQLTQLRRAVGIETRASNVFPVAARNPFLMND